jgi:methionyl-tRNA formyltransferase
MSKKILFFGNERLATGVHSKMSTLQALLAVGYEVAAVVIAQGEAGPSRQQRQLEVATIARQHNIPLLAPADLDSARGQLASFSADAAILIAYGKIVPQAILDLFPRGIINIHPSLLPLHRGPAPIENAILSGASETGVSLMRLNAKMDTGAIYTQATVPLTGTETKQVLADHLSAVGVDMVLKYLPGVLDGSLQPTPQDDQAATYDRHITKADGLLDWAKPAARLEREVRAYAGWPRSSATIGSTEVIITQAHVEEGSDLPGSLLVEQKQLGVYCTEGVLVIDRLIPTGKKDMSAAAFLAGHKLN